MTINLIAFDGDGIGPEIMTSTLEVINHLKTKLSLDVNIEKELIGIKSLKALGTTLPEKALLKSKEADGIILGPVDHIIILLYQMVELIHQVSSGLN